MNQQCNTCSNTCLAENVSSTSNAVMEMCKTQKPGGRRGSRNSAGQSFRLNQEQRPLKIVRSSYQYLYDTTNSEYLDCVNSVSHVGHCHPAVVKAAVTSLEREVSTEGLDIDHGDLKYPDQLRQTLPHHLDTFFFCNSGSEAVDLALQLSALHTGGTDVVVTDNAFHGSIGSVQHLSPKVFKANNISKADWVHILAMPDLYRGQYQRGDPQAVDKYLADAQHIIRNISQSGRKLAGFIAEPMLIVAGMVIPSAAWLQEIYRMVREAGGVCIADEVQAGLGRVGSHFWSFQAQGVSPDILIIGKTVGNGYPMAIVATSREISAVLGDRIKEYGCSRMMDAVGCAVLDVLQEESLMSAAMSVGTFLREQLTLLQHKHDYIGDVRGLGLMVGLEVVWSKESKKPAREVAEHIVHRMKERNVILASEGCHHNILMLMPPMCFSRDNAVHLVQRLDKVLSELPRYCYPVEGAPPIFCPPAVQQSTACEGRLGILQPQEDEDEEDQLASRENLDDPRHSYQDLD